MQYGFVYAKIFAAGDTNLVAAQTYWKSVEDYFLDAAAYDYLDYKELMNQAHQIVTNSDNIVEEPAELQGY